jgi:hypothetical protein
MHDAHWDANAQLSAEEENMLPAEVRRCEVVDIGTPRPVES